MRGNILHYSLDFSSITKINYRAAVTFALESANVVGYQAITLKPGYNIFAPTFDGVSSTLDIQDLKLQGVPGDGSDVIWVLDSDGIVTGDTYYWFSKEITGAETDFWSADGETPLKRPIVSGEGFYVYTESEEASVMVSGSVKIGNYSKNLIPGYNLTGNFSPIAQNIQNLTLSGVPGDGSDVIWVLDSDGIVTGETYYWFSKDVTGADKDFWSADGETPLDLTFEPGEGIYLYTEATDAVINLPAVISAN